MQDPIFAPIIGQQKIWNNLPVDNTDFSSLNSFRRALTARFLVSYCKVFFASHCYITLSQCNVCLIVAFVKFKMSLCYAPECVSQAQNVYDVSPDPLVSGGRGYSLPIPLSSMLSASRLSVASFLCLQNKHRIVPDSSDGTVEQLAADET